MQPGLTHLLPPTLTLALLLPLAAAAETVEIPDPAGGQITLELHRPPDFQADTATSILVSPGEYYWQDRPSQPGWIVAVSDAFYGARRVERSKLVLAWLRERFEPKHAGFHIAGWSANSAGVFEIAMATPADYLSVTGIAGMPADSDEPRLDRLQEIRVQFVVGENDGYWRRGSERWHSQPARRTKRSRRPSPS